MDITPTLEGQVDAGQQTTPEAASVEPTATPAEGTAAPAQNQWNAQEYALNFKGQTILPKDKQYLINLAQQGYGYSQAMEKLNREKQELEQQRTHYSQYENLDKYFQSNPAFKQRVIELQQQMAQGAQQPEQGQIPEQVLQVQNKVEKMYQEMLHKQEDDRLQSEIEKLKTAHKDDKWDVDDGSGTLMQKLLKHTMENNFPSLEAAYRNYMWDSMTARVQADTLKAQQQQQQAAARAGKVVGAGAPPAPGVRPGYDPKMGYDDLKNMALKELGG